MLCIRICFLAAGQGIQAVILCTGLVQRVQHLLLVAAACTGARPVSIASTITAASAAAMIFLNIFILYSS